MNIGWQVTIFSLLQGHVRRISACYCQDEEACRYLTTACVRAAAYLRTTSITLLHASNVHHYYLRIAMTTQLTRLS